MVLFYIVFMLGEGSLFGWVEVWFYGVGYVCRGLSRRLSIWR